MATLRLHQVSKNFGRIEAVKNVSFHCENGQLIAILGPSGAGKTTTLRLIAGLEKLNSGELYIDEQLVNSVPAEEREVAMAFERYVLYPHLTVFQNIAFPLQVPRRKGEFKEKEIRERVLAITKFLEMDQFLERNVTQLSGGQRQRVSFARALVREAKLCLLDEPLAHLDAKLRNRLRGELKRMFWDQKKTVIWVTHDFREAMSMADRIMILDRGVVRQFSSPGEIYHHPADMVVGDMIGDPPMNFLDCSVVLEGGKGIILGEGFKLDLPDRWIQKIHSLASRPEQFTLGVRPINVHVIDGGDEKNSLLRGEVFVLEPAGAKQILTLTIGKKRFKVVVDSHFRANIGKKVTVKVDPERLSLFDAKTLKSVG